MYILPEVGMLTTLVYKLSADECDDSMKTQKLSELDRLICPASAKTAEPCRYQLNAVCNQTADDVSTLVKLG